MLYDKLLNIQKAQYTCAQYLTDYKKKPHSQKDLLCLEENIDMINSDIKLTLKKASILNYTSYVPSHVKEKLSADVDLTTEKLNSLSKEVSNCSSEKVFKKEGLNAHCGIESVTDEMLFWQTLSAIYSDAFSLMKCTKSTKTDKLQYLHFRRNKRNKLHKIFISTIKTGEKCKYETTMSEEIRNALKSKVSLTSKMVRNHLKKVVSYTNNELKRFKSANTNMQASSEGPKVKSDKGNKKRNPRKKNIQTRKKEFNKKSCPSVANDI